MKQNLFFQKRTTTLMLIILFIGTLPILVEAQPSSPSIVVVRDKDLSGFPDGIDSLSTELKGYTTCLQDDVTCGLSIASMYYPPSSKIRIRSIKGCPSRRVVKRNTSAGIIIRQNIPVGMKERCLSIRS